MDARTRLIVAAELSAQVLLDRHRQMIGLWLKASRIEGQSAFLKQHHYHRPHVGLTPMRPPLGPNSFDHVITKDGWLLRRIVEVPANMANRIRTLPGLRGVDVSRIIAGPSYQSRDVLLTREIVSQPGR